ncbi:hypothetical protein MNBD_UNCLBAC01-1, partial [hydrothermal vent metagenome]
THELLLRIGVAIDNFFCGSDEHRGILGRFSRKVNSYFKIFSDYKAVSK